MKFFAAVVLASVAVAFGGEPYAHQVAGNLCYETKYIDDNYRSMGYHLGHCPKKFNEVESKAVSTICDGHSEQNIKTCPGKTRKIVVLKKGITATFGKDLFKTLVNKVMAKKAQFKDVVTAAVAAKKAAAAPFSAIRINPFLMGLAKQAAADAAVPATHMLGSVRDEHGCVGSGGYSWCDTLNKCHRKWEEACPPQHVALAGPLLALGGCKKDNECPSSYCQASGQCHSCGDACCLADTDCKGDYAGGYCMNDAGKTPPYFCHAPKLLLGAQAAPAQPKVVLVDQHHLA